LLTYLIRHGPAEQEHPHGDGARRLTDAGRTQLQSHFNALAAELHVKRIITSPLVRARETAELLAHTMAAVTLAEEPVLSAGRSSGRELLALMQELGDGTALVGHNPELSEAVGLAERRAVVLAPGSVVALQWNGGIPRVLWSRSS
jgi:phosphohistidine phosphatase